MAWRWHCVAWVGIAWHELTLRGVDLACSSTQAAPKQHPSSTFDDHLCTFCSGRIHFIRAIRFFQA
eukprot:9169103-Lingulodinium_polyedra.AAC.1